MQENFMQEDFMQENRVEKAVRLFKEEGHNCAQAVFAAYADKYGIDKETALKMSASFGGGMGRMRLVCGAVSGMLMVNGMENGATDAQDKQAKLHNYEMVQKLAAAFRQANGSIICGELLSMNNEPLSTHPQASERTPQYYRKRPCADYVRCCAEIIEEYLMKKD